MTRYLFRRFALASLLLLVPALLVGCGDDDNPTAPAMEGMVRVAHLSPDAPNVDVWVDSTKVLTNVPFKAFSDYLSLDAGRYQVQVVATGTTSPAVIDTELTVEAGRAVTVSAVGLLANIDVIVSVDQPGPTTNRPTFRFVHASPDAPAVDITLPDGTVLFGNVAFGDVEAYLPVDAGTYDLQVRVAGSDTVVLSFADLDLPTGLVASVYAVGLVGDGSLGALIAVDDGNDGSTVLEPAPAVSDVRVGHLSPDAPNVDVRILAFDGSEVAGLDNVPFGVVSDYIELSSATHRILVYATGTTTNPVIDATVILDPAVDYTVAATGLVGDMDLQPLVLVDDRTPSSATAGDVRFVHTSPDAPAVTINLADDTEIFPSTEFRGFQGYAPIPAGTYDLEVRLASSGAVALSLPGTVIPANTTLTVFAIGLAGDMTLAALPVVDGPAE